MKKIIFLVVAIAMMCADFASAQSRTSYFMEGSYFRTDMNPALAPTRGYLAVPGISGVGQSFTSNFASIDNFIYQKNGELVTALHSSVSPDEFLGRLPEVGKIQENLDVNILSVGLYKRKTFWNFGVGFHANSNIAISKDLFSAIKTLGNNNFDLSSTALNANAYLDAFVGVSFPIGKFVNIGIRGKFLVGLLDVDAQFDQLSANVGTESVTGTLRGQWRGNGILLENKYITPDGGLEYPDDVDPNSLNYLLGNVKSYGAAIDLGAEVRLLGDHLRLSAAVLDLGFIKWAPETHVGGKVKGDFSYEGFDIETREPIINGDINKDLLGLPSYDGYTTRLTCAVNVGVEYNILDNHIAFGLLSHNEFSNVLTYSELTASVNFRATNWLTATFSHTFLNGNKPGIFGAALNIHPAAINLFIGADFIDTRLVKYTRDMPDKGLSFPLNMNTLYLPRYAKSINVYFGLGFNFGRPKYLRVK